MSKAVVYFRVDASIDIGSGHVMRCLSLAGALRERGAHCYFICRAHPGHLGNRIEAEGHRLTLLPPPDPMIFEASPTHAAWLGCGWQEDAGQTLAALASQRPDWIVVDHYAIDARWETQLRDRCGRLAVIDDLADRVHACDLLLDQNLGRDASDYGTLAPAGAQLLIGPRFALLRPEFAVIRPTSLARRERAGVRNILVAMGGVDQPDATSSVLLALGDGSLPSEFEVRVVLGEKAPWIARVQSLAASMPCRCEVLVGVNDMARLVMESDLAIGAGGGMIWERCALGLPSIVISTADNQATSARAVARFGAHWHVGPVSSPDLAERVSSAFRLAISDIDALKSLGDRAAMICDGLGAARVSQKMLGNEVTLRKAVSADAMLLHGWRNHPATRRYFVDPGAVLVEDHLAWMDNAISAADRVLLIAELDTGPIGCIRFDISGTDAEISIYLSPELVGRGLGTMVLECAVRYAQTDLDVGVLRLLARVKAENAKSLGAFRAAGFLPEQEIMIYVVSR